MSTRPIVEQAIAAIEDNGNNTAFEVRDVLTKMLDYTENEDTTPPPPPPIDFFHFFNDGNFVEDPRGARMWYSCRGIKNAIDVGGTANFTFRIRILEGNLGDPEFPIEPEFYQLLKEIVSTDRELTFTVPFLRGAGSDFPETANIRINIKNQDRMAIFIQTEQGISRDSEIFTSIQFHAPEFFNG
ncbi:hypothetical protein POV27_14950 [Aureisphaera galaxeae]|uniref:hypothetical protein n=1 Tax=Aureisphaera galaxeae TaxID=1538023 RepID=UPI00235051B4|nr:hypothetical protein [Aureisphaera galaxeae]MDC8005359.1 hypothetical protein [Aureisphaera galaxeae]